MSLTARATEMSCKNNNPTTEKLHKFNRWGTLDYKIVGFNPVRYLPKIGLLFCSQSQIRAPYYFTHISINIDKTKN